MQRSQELVKHPITYIGFLLDSEAGKITRKAHLHVSIGLLLPRKTENRECRKKTFWVFFFFLKGEAPKSPQTAKKLAAPFKH